MKKKKSAKKKSAIKTVLITLLCLTLVCAAGLFVVGTHYMNKINRVNDTENIIKPEDVEKKQYSNIEIHSGDGQGSDSYVYYSGADPIPTTKRINILLVGQDTRIPGYRERSDAMLVASVNISTGQVDLISFMRDSFVELTNGYSADRLNVAYAYGGFPLLCSALKYNFGIDINGCFEVDFSGFKNIINMIGGVSIYLDADEAAHLSSLGYNTPSAGTYLMDGSLALEYSRIREIDNDFYRTDRQKKVIVSAINQISGLGASQLISLADSALPYLSTNMSNAEIISMVSKCAPMLAKGVSITQCHCPDWNEFVEGFAGDMYVLFPDFDAINVRLRNLIGD